MTMIVTTFQRGNGPLKILKQQIYSIVFPDDKKLYQGEDGKYYFLREDVDRLEGPYDTIDKCRTALRQFVIEHG